MSPSSKYVEIYAKQVEVAREFGVTEATVHNWIKAAEAGKNNLKLTKRDGRNYLVQDEHNRAEMVYLKSKGRKHASNINQFILHADEEKLEQMLGSENLDRVINTLVIHQDIPLKYCYLNEGAKVWNQYYEESHHGKRDDEGLAKASKILIGYLQKFDTVNVVDLGCGNGETAHQIVQMLKANNKFNKYVAIDISEEMLDSATKNIETVVSGEQIESSLIDIEANSIQSKLYSIKKNDRRRVCNLVLFLGTTIGNFGNMINQSRVLKNIKDGMSEDDFLLVSNSFDEYYNRSVFSHAQMTGASAIEMIIPKYLGLDTGVIEHEFIYNTEEQMREHNLILKSKVKIIFPKRDYSIEFDANEKISVWKHKRDTFEFISEKIKLTGLSLKFIYLLDSKPFVFYLSSVL